jgi:hypothetical protein
MKSWAPIVAALLLAAFAVEPGVAQPRDGYQSAQSERPRSRTRVYVRPVYPYRRHHAFYPPPYDIEYPGPNAHRECSGGFATEHRPSGTVITPRLRCWWAAGRYRGP